MSPLSYLRQFAVMVVITFWAAGCANDRRARDIESALANWHRPTMSTPARSKKPKPPVGEIVETKSTAPASSTISEPTVDWYIGEALTRNPSLQASMADVRAKLERIPQVTSLPDPILRSIVRPEPIQTAAGDIYFTLGYSQMLPLLAKLERAGDIAAAEARMAVEQLNTKRVRLISDVEKAYWQTYLLDRSIEITELNRLLLQDMEGVVDTRYRVGKVAQQDLLRLQTELSDLRDKEHRLAMRRSAAAAALNQMMDRPPQTVIPETMPASPDVIQTDVESLIALASEGNPELAMLREQVIRDREQIELAKLGYWPDLTLGVEWSYVKGREAFVPPTAPGRTMDPPINRKSEVGDDNWALTLQMNLPIWSQRIEARKREARHRLMSTQDELRSTENLVAFRIFEAWSRIETQQHTLRVLNTELIPQAQQTYEVTLTSYQAGNTDFLTLIDNWRRLLDFQLMRHRETVDLESAYAELQREVGMQLIGTTSTKDGGVTDE